VSHTILVSSRFQPLHKGHLLFLEKIVELFDNEIIICPLRRPSGNSVKQRTEESDKYEKMLGWTYSLVNNPLPDSQKINFIKYAIENYGVLSTQVVDIIPRVHPYEDWNESLQEIPLKRVWAINSSKSNFDTTKIQHYMSKGEHIISLSSGDFGYRGSEIRQSLKRKERDLGFIPKELHSYFKENCLSYYEENDHEN